MVESGGSVGKLKRNAQPLFRGKSPGFVNLFLCQHVAKLTGRIVHEHFCCNRRFAAATSLDATGTASGGRARRSVG